MHVRESGLIQFIPQLDDANCGSQNIARDVHSLQLSRLRLHPVVQIRRASHGPFD